MAAGELCDYERTCIFLPMLGGRSFHFSLFHTGFSYIWMVSVFVRDGCVSIMYMAFFDQKVPIPSFPLCIPPPYCWPPLYVFTPYSLTISDFPIIYQLQASKQAQAWRVFSLSLFFLVFFGTTQVTSSLIPSPGPGLGLLICYFSFLFIYRSCSHIYSYTVLRYYV